jgi:hypothetical protein
VLIFFSIANASDSTFTFKCSGRQFSIKKTNNLAVNFKEFRKFLKLCKKDGFTEVVVKDITGDGIKDSLINNAVVYDNNKCKLNAIIISKGKEVYTSEIDFSKEEADEENMWGNDSVYKSVYPYSLLFYAYLIRTQSFYPDRKLLNDMLEMFLYNRRDELTEKGLSKDSMDSEINTYKEWIFHYKGKFINNPSLSDYDTYIFDSRLNKFVLFYAP